MEFTTTNGWTNVIESLSWAEATSTATYYEPWNRTVTKTMRWERDLTSTGDVHYLTAAERVTAMTWGEWKLKVDGPWPAWTRAKRGTATFTAHCDCSTTWVDYSVPEPAQTTLRKMLRQRLFPAVQTNAKPVGHTHDLREQRARETLRRVIGDDKYNRFLRQGHVNVRGRSGLVYRICPGHGWTEVYDKGRMVERLCVVLQGDFPPTDSVIIRYLLILNNEGEFRKKANIHRASVREAVVSMAGAHESLVDIARKVRNGEIVRHSGTVCNGAVARHARLAV